MIVFAVIAGIYTGVMALLPIARETSFADISISFECWILFGVLIIGIAIVLAATAFSLAGGRQVYNTTVLVNGGSLNVEFDDSYKASLEDESYGEVFIVYEENIESYMVNAKFKKTGDTKLILESPEGEKRTFSLTIRRNSYDIDEIKDTGQ